MCCCCCMISYSIEQFPGSDYRTIQLSGDSQPSNYPMSWVDSSPWLRAEIVLWPSATLHNNRVEGPVKKAVSQAARHAINGRITATSFDQQATAVPCNFPSSCSWIKNKKKHVLPSCCYTLQPIAAAASYTISIPIAIPRFPDANASAISS